MQWSDTMAHMIPWNPTEDGYARLRADIQDFTKCCKFADKFLDAMIDDCEELFYQITGPPNWEHQEIAVLISDMNTEINRWRSTLKLFASALLRCQAMMEFSLLRIITLA